MVIGSGRPGTSRCLLQGYFSVGDGVCWVAERGGDVVELEWREFGDDLFGGHAVGEHAEHGGGGGFGARGCRGRRPSGGGLP